MINVTATGTEILKNLILPGVSSFTIVDAACVRGDDAGNNFFLSRDAVGKPRAEVAVASLLELNTDVAGNGGRDETGRRLFCLLHLSPPPPP